MNQKNVIILVFTTFVLAGIGIFYSFKNSSIPTEEETPLVAVDNDDFATPRNDPQQRMRSSKSNCLSDDCLALNDLEYPAGALSDSVTTALNKALDDEYKAYSTYESVIAEFGNKRPFIMIIRAEEQHISSLKSIYDKYGLEIPENPYVGGVSIPDSLSEACVIGVQAEIENAALYRDELLPAVSDYEDITMAFTNLMNASQNKHLPAFERCSN